MTMTYERDYYLEDCIADAFSDLKWDYDYDSFRDIHFDKYLEQFDLKVTKEEYNKIFDKLLDLFYEKQEEEENENDYCWVF